MIHTMVGPVVPIQGSPMGVAHEPVYGDWFLVLLTHDGVVVDRLAFGTLGRGGCRLVGEWINLARPPVGDVWAILNAIPARERVGVLAMVDTEAIGDVGEMPEGGV